MKNHNIKLLNYFSFLIKVLLFSLLSEYTLANDDKIGTVTEINGTIVAINDELEERDLLIHDPFFLNEEIFVTEGSSATIQFNDSTTVIMKELTSINVSEFENSKKNPKLKAELVKGKIIIESGSIAKKDNGEMIVGVTTSSLGLRGTRVDIDLKPSGKSNISLAKDSFGNVGVIEVNSGGQTSNITSTEQVLEISENNETTSRDKTEEEKEEAKSVGETLIKSSKIDEEEIIKQLQQKLQDGNLQDANNDGVVDGSDVEVTKEQITNEKKQNIDFIVENSKDENTEFLSDVINQSDEKSTVEVIEKIIEGKDNLVEGVVENLSDKDNKFLTSSTSEGAGLIKEKIFETIVAKETDKSAAILSKVMAKADDATVASVINNITEKNTNEDSKLSLKVMADFSEKNPEKLETLSQNNADQIEKLTISAVEKAESSKEDADLIAKVVAVANYELVNKVVEEVSKSSTEEKQTLSAQVLKAIVDSNSGKIDIINEDVKDTMIKQTIESAQNQAEGTGVQVSEDMTSIVSDIIVNTDTETGSKMIEELNNSAADKDNDLSLKVISDISEKDTTKLNVLSENNKEQIEKLTETAIKNADASEESAELIAKVVAVSSDELVNKVVEEVSKSSTEEKQTLSAQVLKAIVDSNSGKIDIINEDVKDTMIKQTIESAQNQAEGTGVQVSEDMTSIVSDIIVNTDTETGSKMIEELNNSAADKDNDLSLKVISDISEKDTTKLNVLSENNKEQIEKLTETAIKNADASEESAELIAKVVAVSSDELVNKVVEEVSKSSTEEKQTLSAQVMKSIVETNPEKIETLSYKNKETIINQTIEAAKNQAENVIKNDTDLSSVVSKIIINSNENTSLIVLENLNDKSEKTKSSLSLNVFKNLAKEEKFEEKIESISKKSVISENAVEKLIEKSIDDIKDSKDITVVKDIIKKGGEFLSKKIVEIDKKTKNENKSKISKILDNIIKEDPKKAKEIIKKEKKKEIQKKIKKPKKIIEIKDVIDTNISAN
ncbi:FecR domain-containing protein [Candidatus Pelagibacter sp. HTCC7211]|uniref:FecR domain-containing protein n=1 Tax=Pelagibacter sp. (strain HTCC7211) TaxID=439493 RepID=UPI0005556343|nr:FecR domain-containing protein [Candidatus Pelagibacter sp. HTCC7211]